MSVEKEVVKKWALGIIGTDGSGSCMAIAFSEGTRLSQKPPSVKTRDSIFYPTVINAIYRGNLRRALGPKPALR